MSHSQTPADAERIQRILRQRTEAALRQRFEGVVPAPLPEPSGNLSFAPDLAKALFAGRKTQTRRLVRPQPTTALSGEDCPIVRVGQHLRVREPWARDGAKFVYCTDPPRPGTRLLPGMYMPHAAARTLLRIDAVRCERLWAITEADALAEGCPPADAASPLAWFAETWNRFFTLPGERYADNPFVWVISFSAVPIAPA